MNTRWPQKNNQHIYILGLIDETNLSNLREIYLYIWWERHMANVVTDFFYFLLPP